MNDDDPSPAEARTLMFVVVLEAGESVGHR
jgi:hypothetical protein